MTHIYLILDYLQKLSQKEPIMLGGDRLRRIEIASGNLNLRATKMSELDVFTPVFTEGT